MRFERVRLCDAVGHVLGHNVSHGGRRVLRKGLVLSHHQVEELARLGLDSVYVAQLSTGDVPEDIASRRIGAVLGERGGIELQVAHGGRVSLRAIHTGLLSLSPERLLELNLIDGVTLATLPNHSVVTPGAVVATLKIIPFALPEASVTAAERLASAGVLECKAIPERRVCLLICGSEDRRSKLLSTFEKPLRERLAALTIVDVDVAYAALGSEPEKTLARALSSRLDERADLVIIAGETATMDREDLAPRAIRLAGGRVAALGAPVFPGNLLLLGYRGAAAILGAPGCVRSRDPNIVDLLLPRLLIGEALGAREIAELGLGGMLARGGPARALEADGHD